MPTDLPRALAFLLGFWLAITMVGPLAGTAAGETISVPDPALEQLERDLHHAINAVRAHHHLLPLQRDVRIDRVARAHSTDMATRGYLSHDTPEGENPVDRLRRGGVEGFSLAGENVGRTNRAEPNREILEGWLTSPEHRRNLLASVYNAAGLAIARAPDGTLVYTQVYVTYPR